LSPLVKLVNLSRISLNLEGNAIQEEGAKFLLYSVSAMRNLLSLSLEMSMNKIGIDGARFLLSPLSNLLNL